MKKILFLANSSFSMFFFRKGLIRALAAQGYKVHVAAPEDYKTEELKTLGCQYHALNFQTRKTNPFLDLFLLWRFYKLYKKIKPDVIFQYTIKPNIYGSIAAWLSGIPSFAVVTGLGYAFLTESWINKLVQHMYRFAFRYSSGVWFLNTDDLDFFVERKIVTKNKTFLLPGEGVNTTEFNPSKNTFHENGFTFLMIARVLWDKGAKEYVEAAEKIKAIYPHARFQLLGATDADNPSAVPRAVVDEWHHKGKIEYLGLSTDVTKEIAAADCIVLPSYREGISKVLMEAASMAKPLIATNVTGCKELIDEGINGYLCKVKDVDSLAEKMKQVLSLSPKALLQMGKAGREKMIREFDERKIISIYQQHIQSS
jgi:glycosyltransferase involved in cell wall biosynthesis